MICTCFCPSKPYKTHTRNIFHCPSKCPTKCPSNPQFNMKINKWRHASNLLENRFEKPLFVRAFYAIYLQILIICTIFVEINMQIRKYGEDNTRTPHF